MTRATFTFAALATGAFVSTLALISGAGTTVGRADAAPALSVAARTGASARPVPPAAPADDLPRISYGTVGPRDQVMILSVGESRAINLAAKMTDVVIANPNVIDVHVRSNNQLYVMAKSPGESSLHVTTRDGRILYSGSIRVGNNLTSVDQMLRLAMPEANIVASNMNGMTLLTGTIKAPEDAAEAERLVQAFVGKDVTVVSRLRTATPLQVNLQVKISEVSRNLLHKIGTNIATWDAGRNSIGYVGRSTRDFVTRGTDAATGATTYTFNQPTDGSTTLGFVARMFGMDVAGALDLAETAGLATTLAQPNLTSLSGETASFLAGGEYPYSVSNGLQGNTIEFKQYGVQLAFTPTVLADGRVSLRVRPSVTSLDFSINSNVPALKSRTAETTVELGSGQAFMIAGLLSSDTANNIDKVPGLGDIPVLGSLFKSRQFQRNETELVIVVTPYLVRPVNAADIRLPTEGFRNADEMQGLLLNQAHDGRNNVRDPGPRIAPGPGANDASPLPSVGMGTPPAPPPPPPAAARAASRDRRAEANVAPGFSF